MSKLWSFITAPAPLVIINLALFIMRVGIGILTIGHGFPKIMGGIPMWKSLGTFVYPLGIHFLPIMWGFLGACTEFLGGIALTLGFGTRIASLSLMLMMFVAVMWHLDRGDSYNIYSFPLSLIIVFFAYFLIGSGAYSIDSIMRKRRQISNSLHA